jgi:hypothetical protein
MRCTVEGGRGHATVNRIQVGQVKPVTPKNRLLQCNALMHTGEGGRGLETVNPRQIKKTSLIKMQ